MSAGAQVRVARYRLPCPECGTRFLKGYSSIILHTDSGLWVHAGCLDRFVQRWANLSSTA